jgi:hypothetical protein
MDTISFDVGNSGLDCHNIFFHEPKTFCMSD